MTDAYRDWRKLCQEAVPEKDPDKLMRIVTALNGELDDDGDAFEILSAA